jgi:hypothetical protein
MFIVKEVKPFLRYLKNRMSACRIIHSILFLTAFIYLVMCPVVEDFGDNLRYDLVRKIGARKSQNNLKKFASPTFKQLPANIQTVCLSFSGNAREHLFFLSSYSFLNLSILSTVRLIL